MTDDGEMVVVLEARTPFEAQAVAAILRSEGILVHIDGELLQDEMASARAAFGQNATVVKVPPHSLERAHEAIAAAKLAGKALDQSDD